MYELTTFSLLLLFLSRLVLLLISGLLVKSVLTDTSSPPLLGEADGVSLEGGLICSSYYRQILTGFHVYMVTVGFMARCYLNVYYSCTGTLWRRHLRLQLMTVVLDCSNINGHSHSTCPLKHLVLWPVSFNSLITRYNVLLFCFDNGWKLFFVVEPLSMYTFHPHTKLITLQNTS